MVIPLSYLFLIISFFIDTFQDTVVALHALSLYNIRTYARDINLNISLSSTSNAQFRKDLMLTQGDALVQKSVDDVRIVQNPRGDPKGDDPY